LQTPQMRGVFGEFLFYTVVNYHHQRRWLPVSTRLPEGM
jgi:hypothetical protein